MLNKDIDDDTSALLNHTEDELSEGNLAQWMKKHSHKIGKLTIRPFPMGGGKPRTLLEEIALWWWSLSNIFKIAVEIGFSGINLQFWIFNTGFTIIWGLPNFRISLPFLSKLNLEWHAWAYLGKNKGIEIQTWYTENLKIGFCICQNMHTDHFGIFAELDLLFFHIEFSLYDGRHWDSTHNKPDEWLEDKECWASNLEDDIVDE